MDYICATIWRKLTWSLNISSVSLIYSYKNIILTVKFDFKSLGILRKVILKKGYLKYKDWLLIVTKHAVMYHRLYLLINLERSWEDRHKCKLGNLNGICSCTEFVCFFFTMFKFSYMYYFLQSFI